jgi:hypothetical protein
MIEVRETIIQELPDLRVVINAKDVKGALLFELGRGATAGSTVDLDGPVVALRHAIYGKSVHFKTGFVDS